MGRDRRGGRHTGKETKDREECLRDSYQEHFTFVLSAGHGHKKTTVNLQNTETNAVSFSPGVLKRGWSDTLQDGFIHKDRGGKRRSKEVESNQFFVALVS